MTQWQELYLANSELEGVKLYLEVDDRNRRKDVGVLESLPFDKITSIVSEVSRSLVTAMANAGPTRSTIELGLEFGIENGTMVGLIAKGSGKANFKLTMEWDKSQA